MMIEFLGITALHALIEMPMTERLYYQYVINHGDKGYYNIIANNFPSKLPIVRSFSGEIEQCTLIASKLTGVNPKYIRTIMRTEAGWPGAQQKAANGSADVGIAQINPKVWDVEFRRMGIKLNWDDVRDNVCPNLYVSAVILSTRLVNAKSPDEGLANYHRYITKNNAHSHLNYRLKAIKHLSDIEMDYMNWMIASKKANQYIK